MSTPQAVSLLPPSCSVGSQKLLHRRGMPVPLLVLTVVLATQPLLPLIYSSVKWQHLHLPQRVPLRLKRDSMYLDDQQIYNVSIFEFFRSHTRKHVT